MAEVAEVESVPANVTSEDLAADDFSLHGMAKWIKT